LSFGCGNIISKVVVKEGVSWQNNAESVVERCVAAQHIASFYWRGAGKI